MEVKDRKSDLDEIARLRDALDRIILLLPQMPRDASVPLEEAHSRINQAIIVAEKALGQ